MKVERSVLEKRLTLRFSKIEDRTLIQNYCIELEQKYNIPMSISSDIICLRKDLSSYNDFFVYAITDVVAPKIVSEVFTEREIATYKEQKFETQQIKFPIKLKMFQVTPDQWIGVSSVNFLMKLREAQYINYNAETQRALEIMVKGGKEIYRPSVDVKSVGEIEEAYANKSFIPNTISLNISQDDEEADFYFKDDTLIIESITAFDIFDGYHRYLAMARNYDMDNEFDYPIELRITNFSVSKAKQFIYQEDHKTKMKKVNREAYDQQNPGNMVCDRLNSDSSFNLYNKINLTDGLINYGELSAALCAFFFNGKNVERKLIIHLSKELRDKLNAFTEEYEEYLERKWERHEIFEIAYGIYKGFSNETIKDGINNITKDNKTTIQYYVNNSSKKKLINAMEEVYSNV